MYQLSFSNTFLKELKKLSPELQKQTKQKLSILITNKDHPSLRLKPNHSWSKFLKTKAFEISINMNFRIILTFEENATILLHNVGDHNSLDKI